MAVRIDPRSGRAFEESAIYPAGLRIKPGYRENNWVFSGDKKQVTLAGARNEVLAFQLQIESDRPLGNVSVAISDLRGPARFPAAETIRLFKRVVRRGEAAVLRRCVGLSVSTALGPAGIRTL